MQMTQKVDNFFPYKMTLGLHPSHLYRIGSSFLEVWQNQQISFGSTDSKNLSQLPQLPLFIVVGLKLLVKGSRKGP